MALTIIADILDASASHDSNGIQPIRTFQVSGFAAISAPSKVLSILADPGVPQLGDTHPGDITLTVLSRQVSLTGPDDATVSVTYGVASATAPDPPVTTIPHVNIQQSFSTTQTNLDKDGNLLVVTDGGSPPFTQTGTVEKQIPHTVVTATRLETYPLTSGAFVAQGPGDQAQHFGGKVNKTTFLGHSAHYWLCSVSSVFKSASQWETTYTFQSGDPTRLNKVGGGVSAELGWDVAVFLTDSQGNPPASYSFVGFGLPGNVNVELYPIYQAQEFNDLNLGI